VCIKFLQKIGEGPKYQMGQRTSSGGIFVTNDAPGPGAYKPVSCNTSAKFSMKGKHYIGTSIVITPDGGHEKMTEVGRQMRTWTRCVPSKNFFYLS
jgi:hypothetical protein